jgi:beta-N-acetylhexosaminidase
MPLRNQVALLTWPAIYMEHYTPARNAVRDEGLGGVLLMNVRGTEASLKTRLKELKSLSPYGLVVATDEEGGDVQRLRNLRPLPSQQVVSTTMTTSGAYSLILDQGKYMRSLGINMVLGPVVDVLPKQGEPPLATSRFFAGDPSTVGAYADAYVKAWHDAGLGTVLKHFPGHGSATADTHQGSSTTPPLSALESRDLVPYQMLEGSGADVMVGHLIVPDLTNGVPATRSPEAVTYLRKTLGYGDALVVSDALDMGAVGLPPTQAAVDAIAAGIDVVLLADVDEEGAINEVGGVIDAIVNAVQSGELPAARVNEAANRVLAFLAKHGGHCPT